MLNEDPAESKSTIVLDEIFNPAKGWQFSPDQIPLQRKISADGTPFYLVTVDDLPLTVFEQSKWREGVISDVSPSRIIVTTRFRGVTLTDPRALLRGSYATRGLPSFGLDEEEGINLHTALPIGPVPADLVRKQVMVCMGLLRRKRELNSRFGTRTEILSSIGAQRRMWRPWRRLFFAPSSVRSGWVSGGPRGLYSNVSILR
jgi:hypothetical protein